MDSALKAIQISHAVVDVAITTDTETPIVIELNPWGMRAGSALFDWNEDAALLHGIEAKEVGLRLVENVGSFGAERIPVEPLCKCDFINLI